MILRKFIIQERRVIMKVSWVTQTHKNLLCNQCWTRKKKQPDAKATELAKGDEGQCDVLSVTGRSVNNKDRQIIDSGCSQHISSNIKMFTSYTSTQGEKSSWGILLNKVIGKGTIQYHSQDRCITTLQDVCHVFDLGYNLISLRVLQGEGFSFSFEEIL